MAGNLPVHVNTAKIGPGRPRISSPERKAKKAQNQRHTTLSRVYLGCEGERWRERQISAGLTPSQFAKLLLDLYDSSMGQHNVTALTSTPHCAESTTIAQHMELQSTRPSPCLSSPVHSSMDTNLESPLPRLPAKRAKTTEKCDAVVAEVTHSFQESPAVIQPRTHDHLMDTSFVDPFDLSIDVSHEEYLETDDADDPDYDPQLDGQDPIPQMTIKPQGFDDVGHEEVFEEGEFSGDENDVDGEGGAETSDELVGRVTDSQSLTSSNVYLVYEAQLKALADIHVASRCPRCGDGVEMNSHVIGSAVHFKWVCRGGHEVQRWASQPIMNFRLHGGDFMLSAAILLSGNNYAKFKHLADCLHLPIVSATTYYKIQSFYLLPTINNFWVDHQKEVLDSLISSTATKRPVIVIGDGRMDSPGFCAQYCTYVFMEYETKRVIHMVTMDKREVGGKSPNMEKACFTKGLKQLLNWGVHVVEVVTDGHLGIQSVMKKDFPQITHSLDTWHGSKNVGKKMTAVAMEKDNRELLPWVRHGVNFFYKCAEIATSAAVFKVVLHGMMFHVRNIHEWPLSIIPCDAKYLQCQHSELSDERSAPWLEGGSAAHKALFSVIMNKTLLQKLHYYIRNRSSAEIENFNSLVLMYSSKRHTYQPPAYQGRTTLAALDHNNHLDRPVLFKPDGTPRWHRQFNKKSCRYTVQPVKAPKEYIYMNELMVKIVDMRLADTVGMQGRVELSAHDPRRIAPVIAPIAPPPTADLAAAHRSRFPSERGQ